MEASGSAVGLPDGQMGNSEVGHLNLGAGAVVKQDLTRIDEAVEDGTTVGHVDRIILILAGFLLVGTVLTRYARYASQVLGEQVLAELREDFVGNALALPVGVIESAGSGDLLTRTSRDVDQLGWSVRWALPEWTIAVVSAVLTFAAALSVGWWVALPCVLGVPPLVIGLRWYLARAKDGYLRESASYSVINATLTETVEGARTVEALGIGAERIGQIDEDIKESYDAEKYTLFLRTVFFPNMEIAYLIPTVVTLLFGGWLYLRGEVSLGDVTAATLYVQMLVDPLDRVVSILDELQVGGASLARPSGAPASTHFTIVSICLSVSRASFVNDPCAGSANQGGIFRSPTASLILVARLRTSS